MEAEGDTFEHEGETIHAIVRRQLAPGDTFAVEILEARPDQGISLSVEDGAKLGVGATEARDLVIWRETAPDVTEIRYVNPRKRTELTVWSVWEDDGGTTQAWIGWAGMRVEEPDDDTVLLRCSGNFDAPRFDDLVVRLTFARR